MVVDARLCRRRGIRVTGTNSPCPANLQATTGRSSPELPPASAEDTVDTGREPRGGGFEPIGWQRRRWVRSGMRRGMIWPKSTLNQRLRRMLPGYQQPTYRAAYSVWETTTDLMAISAHAASAKRQLIGSSCYCLWARSTSASGDSRRSSTRPRSVFEGANWAASGLSGRVTAEPHSRNKQ